MPGMSAKEFAAKLRKELPELKDFKDSEIVSKVLQLRPDLINKVENPLFGDEQAAKAQQAAQAKANQQSAFTRSVLSAFPALGAITGGVVGSPGGPWTSLGGSSIGAGAGRATEDLASRVLGLQAPNSMSREAGNIALDTGLTAAMPGAVDDVLHPVSTFRGAVRGLSDLEDVFIPKGIRPYVKSDLFDRLASYGEGKANPMQRPAWQNWSPADVTVDTTKLKPESDIIEGEIVPQKLAGLLGAAPASSGAKSAAGAGVASSMTDEERQKLEDFINQIFGFTGKKR